MKRRAAAGIVAVFVLIAALFGAAFASGCSGSTTSPSPPGVGPVNTNPEPLESPNASQTPAEESESVHASSAP